MDAQQFLVEFWHIANAPGGIERLRELIYQFAVTGRLVPQQVDEGKALATLENITRIRRQLVAEKRWKRSPKLESAPLELPAIELPASWQWSRLLDLGEINPRNLPADEAKATFVPMAAISEKHGKAVEGEEANWSDISKGYTHFANGDVLLAKITPCFENGKAAVVSGLKHGVGSGSTEFHVFRPMCEDVNASYIYLFVRSPLFRVKGQTNMTGTAGQKRLPTDYFALCALPLPPKAEQSRIVVKVDELMALCDKLETQQQARRKLQNNLRQSTLQAVASATSPHELQTTWSRLAANFGQLFSEPGDVEDFQKAMLTLVFHGKLGAISETPKHVTLSSILAEASVNGVSKGPTKDTSATEVLKISAGTSRADFNVDEDDFKHVDLSAQEVEKFRLMPGDLLACRYNGNLHYVGRFSYFRGQTGRTQVNPDKLIRFRIASQHDPRYVCLVMNAEPSRQAIEAMCATTAGNIGLSAGRLKTIEIPLPSLSEQRQIVERVGELMMICGRLEKKLLDRKRLAESLAAASIANLTGIAIEQEEVTHLSKAEAAT